MFLEVIEHATVLEPLVSRGVDPSRRQALEMDHANGWDNRRGEPLILDAPVEINVVEKSGNGSSDVITLTARSSKKQVFVIEDRP